MKLNFPEKFNSIKIFIWPLLALVFTVILLLIVIIPQFSNIVITTNTIEEEKERVRKLNQKADALEQIDVALYQDHLTNTLFALPPEKDFPSAISQIQIIANQTNVRVSDLGVSVVSKVQSGHDSFLINLTIQGDIVAINDFLKAIRGGPRVMSINNLDFTQSQAEFYQVTLSVSTYFQPVQTNIGSVDAPIAQLSEDEINTLVQLNQLVEQTNLVSVQTVTGPRGKPNPFQ